MDRPCRSIPTICNNFFKRRVSSAIIMSTFAKTCVALYEKSEAVPIGVDTMYNKGSRLGNLSCNLFSKFSGRV